MNAKSCIIQVIKTEYTKGKGTQEDPARQVTAYFNLNGTLICERDEYLENLKRDELIKCGQSTKHVV